MPEKTVSILVDFISCNSKYFPYALGIGVSFSFADLLMKILFTVISMVAGAVAVHFFAPKIINWIKALKKN